MLFSCHFSLFLLYFLALFALYGPGLNPIILPLHRLPTLFENLPAGRATLQHQAAAAFTISTLLVPKNFCEAMEYPEVWMAPMEKEYKSLMGHEVWVLMDPPGTNVIDCKWAYAVKYNIEGEIIKWNLTLLRRGSCRSLALISSRHTSVLYSMSLLGYCVNKPGWIMWAMDIVSMHLNSEMKEVVYMQQPEGFVVPGVSNGLWVG
jgi:hypothetical protein